MRKPSWAPAFYVMLAGVASALESALWHCAYIAHAIRPQQESADMSAMTTKDGPKSISGTGLRIEGEGRERPIPRQPRVLEPIGKAAFALRGSLRAQQTMDELRARRRLPLGALEFLIERRRHAVKAQTRKWHLQLVRSEEHTSELQSLRHLVCR